MKFENLLADRTEKMGKNAIREILKVVSQPGMISLAGGIPSPESFPLKLIEELTKKVLDKYSSTAFQYDLTEGFLPFRETLSDYLLEQSGIKSSPEDILVFSGSQGVLDGLGKILISKGDKIAVEAPTYLGAISAFDPYEPEYIRMETDENGLIPEALEEILKENKIKFIYLVPTFQNPSGRTIPLERREKIAEIIKKYNGLLIEDDPYSALRYKGKKVPAIKTLAPDNVVYISTLSKTFAPGLRLGFVAAPELIRQWLVIVKQGVDLHTSTFNQALASEYIKGGYLDDHLPKITKLYKPKHEAMLKALEKDFPSDFTWSKPEGGMFIWVEGPKHYDMEKVYEMAVKKKVAFVPGTFFFTEKNEGKETMRLNYTMSSVDEIDEGVKRLGDVLKMCGEGRKRRKEKGRMTQHRRRLCHNSIIFL